MKATKFNTDFLKTLNVEPKNPGASTGVQWLPSKGKLIESHTPVDGSLIGAVNETSRSEYDKVVDTAQKAFKEWRMMPAPKRGEIVRQIGDELRKNKEPLGKLVSWEMGKSL